MIALKCSGHDLVVDIEAAINNLDYVAGYPNHALYVIFARGRIAEQDEIADPWRWQTQRCPKSVEARGVKFHNVSNAQRRNHAARDNRIVMGVTE